MHTNIYKFSHEAAHTNSHTSSKPMISELSWKTASLKHKYIQESDSIHTYCAHTFKPICWHQKSTQTCMFTSMNVPTYTQNCMHPCILTDSKLCEQLTANELSTVLEGCCYFLERAAYNLIRSDDLSAQLQIAGMLQGQVLYVHAYVWLYQPLHAVADSWPGIVCASMCVCVCVCVCVVVSTFACSCKLLSFCSNLQSICVCIYMTCVCNL
jgi:hypothetical protein